MVDLAKFAKTAKKVWIFTSLRTLRAWRDPVEKPTPITGLDFMPDRRKKILSIIELALIASRITLTYSANETNL
ncbi:MAG: hypothetical protein WD750_12670 [Gammaproteobacteria bacterium]